MSFECLSRKLSIIGHYSHSLLEVWNANKSVWLLRPFIEKLQSNSLKVIYQFAVKHLYCGTVWPQYSGHLKDGMVVSRILSGALLFTLAWLACYLQIQHIWLSKNSLHEPMQYLHSEPAVGLQHFVLSLVEGVFQPLLQHLDETARVDVICRADEPQHWRGKEIYLIDIKNKFLFRQKWQLLPTNTQMFLTNDLYCFKIF